MESNGRKKWTLMFFFASDNTLSPSMLYQLKSIKTAGFQEEANVLVHFDPHERGLPSMIFDINKKERQKGGSKIGDEKDPKVHALDGDRIAPETTDEEPVHTKRQSDPEYTDELPAVEALTRFLDLCRKRYPAERYMLFLVGHGLVVGRDAFLPDDNPYSGIGLVELGTILRNFCWEIGRDSQLELIGMHSCSMSAVEVAYQLKGTANYMLASEGLSFVGIWPYRQMLQKIFSAIKEANGENISVIRMMKRLHELCIHNSADFIFAGYSSDLCLCTLDQKRVEALTRPVRDLTEALKAGLDDERGKALILLAHWKSQSYFQEMYTDLYDFCFCLRDSCSKTNPIQNRMKLACQSVIETLDPETRKGSKGPILQADFYGPDCQYSHGLSIYFPWSRPIEDASEHFIKNYKTYAFVSEPAGTAWLDFLETYFEKTKRPAQKIKGVSKAVSDWEASKIESLRYKPVGFPYGSSGYASSALTGGKVSPADASGYWTASIVKNYSRNIAMTERAFKVFGIEKRRTKKKTASTRGRP